MHCVVVLDGVGAKVYRDGQSLTAGAWGALYTAPYTLRLTLASWKYLSRVNDLQFEFRVYCDS